MKIVKVFFRYLLFCLFITLFWPFLIYKLYTKKSLLLPNTILVINHYSNWDHFIIQMVFFWQPIRFIANKNVRRNPFTRFVCWLTDCFYVDENNLDISTIKNVVNYLKKGGKVGIFPEGYINLSKSGFLPFKNGVALLARRAKANIVPVYLLPKITPFKLSRVFVGNPLEIDYTIPVSNTDFTAHIMSVLMELSLKDPKRKAPIIN